MECKVERNKEFCNCTYSCSKKGVCCECIIYHKRLNQLPACFFPVDVEKTYDRSIKRFIECYKDNPKFR